MAAARVEPEEPSEGGGGRQSAGAVARRHGVRAQRWRARRRERWATSLGEGSAVQLALGGSRAGARGSGAEGSPRWVRISAVTIDEKMQATTRRFPDVTEAVERFFLGANVDAAAPTDDYDVDYRQALG